MRNYLIQYFQAICDRMYLVHKIFYASGFIYHLPTQQILLHRRSLDSTDSSWSLFSTQHNETTQPEAAFSDLISKIFHKKFKEIYPIYTYTQDSSNITHSLLYAKTYELENFAPENGYTFQWFSFKDIIKLPMDQQTRHNIVVGQRVIEAVGRKERGEHTF